MFTHRDDATDTSSGTLELDDIPTEPRPPIRMAEHQPWRTVGIVGTLGMLAALIFVAIFRERLFPSPTPIMQREIHLVALGFGCVVDADWSPDGSAIAVAGYATSCERLFLRGPSGAAPVFTGALGIFRSRDGEPIFKLFPDAQIYTAIQGTPTDRWLFRYGSITWSRDGRRLAWSFFAQRFLPNHSIDERAGLVLASADGKDLQVITTTIPLGTSAASMILWDLQTRTAAAVIPYDASTPFPKTISPAREYHWDQASLIPGPSLIAANGGTANFIGPIGEPASGQRFSPWQAGTIRAFLPAAYWTTTFNAWSGDERYLATQVSIGGRIQLPGSPPIDDQTLLRIGLNQTDLLPLRDAGEQRALTIMAEHSPSQTGRIAWRRDGRFIALYDSSLAGILIFDGVSGADRLTLTPPQSRDVLTGTDKILRWSPDGRTILLTGTQVGTLYLWDLGGTLP